MATITNAAEFWNARAALSSADEAQRICATATLIRLSLGRGAIADRAADTLMERFGARIAIA
jgi:hypothetical protein